MSKDGRGRPQSGVQKTGPGNRMSAWLNDNLDTLTSMTNEELADALGYARPNIISMWRTGRTRVPLDRVVPLAEILGVNISLMLTLWMDQYSQGNDYAKLTKLLAQTVSADEAELIGLVRDHTKGRSFDVRKTDAKKLIPQFITVHK